MIGLGPGSRGVIGALVRQRVCQGAVIPTYGPSTYKHAHTRTHAHSSLASRGAER